MACGAPADRFVVANTLRGKRNATTGAGDRKRIPFLCYVFQSRGCRIHGRTKHRPTLSNDQQTRIMKRTKEGSCQTMSTSRPVQQQPAPNLYATYLGTSIVRGLPDGQPILAMARSGVCSAAWRSHLSKMRPMALRPDFTVGLPLSRLLEKREGRESCETTKHYLIYMGRQTE